MKKKGLVVATIVAEIIFAIGVMSVFKACDPMEDGSWMNCHYAQLDVFYVTLGMIALSVAGTFFNKKQIKIITYIGVTLLGVFAFFIPGIIVHMCMMKTMRCYTMLQVFTRICSVVVVILALLSIIFGLSGEKSSGLSFDD